MPERELEEKIANARSDEEVIQIFTNAGLDVTLEQLAAIKLAVTAIPPVAAVRDNSTTSKTLNA